MRRFLNLCIEIEEMVAGVYRELASGSHAEDGLKNLWMEMALEEEDHARQLRLATRLPAAEAIRKPLISRARVEKLHGKAQTLLQQIKGRALTQETALRLSLLIEKEFAVVHANCAVEFADGSMQALFHTLASDDERHADALADYCKNAGIPIGESVQ